MSAWVTFPTTGPVKWMTCPRCDVTFTFQPPIWLGGPWPRDVAERTQREHMRLAHGETEAPDAA